ncbi:MAG: hypothetical protein H6712_02615 [Myxococcales bacterium]|nr:hypothetical protein [Myxococcales bacterium]MCB9712722.1 hypothetical protein [Myxococcales bacterium]
MKFTKTALVASLTLGSFAFAATGCDKKEEKKEDAAKKDDGEKKEGDAEKKE